MSYIQVPADGVGKRVDTVTLTDALAEVHRQKIILAGGSGTAEVVVVTNAAPAGTDMGLVVRQAGTVDIALAGKVTLSGTAQVAIGTPFTVNDISKTVQVAISTPFVLDSISATVGVKGQVSLAAGTSVIGTINNISATTIVAGVVSLGAGTNNIGFINNISATVIIAMSNQTLQGISTTVTVTGVVNISNTPSVILAAGTANFGTLNDISRTVQVAVGTPFTIQGISTTVATSTVIRTSGGTAVEDAVNNAIRVNVVAGSGSGFFMVDGTSFTAQEASFVPIGGIFDDATPGALTENEAGVVRMTSARAMHSNLRAADGTELGAASATGLFIRTATVAFAADQILGSISRTVQVAVGTPFILQGISTTVIIAMSNQTLQGISTTVTVTGVVNISNTPSVILAAGTGNFGTLNDISRTVQVAVGTPFIIQGISTTVTTVVAGYTPAVMAASHGPKCVTASTSSNVTLIASPGSGFNIYVTQLMVGNASATLTKARIGTSASIATVVQPLAASGGGFVFHFDPPWMLSASEACLCSVKPNVADVLFTVNFFVK